MAELQELNGNGEADDWRDGEMMSGSGEGSCGGELLVSESRGVLASPEAYSGVS